MSETIEEVFDTINELKDSNEKLESDNKIKENEIINNKKSIEEANQKIEKIMKELVEKGGFDKENMIELIMLNKLINLSQGEFSEHKSSMSKCLDLLINFSNQFLEIYKSNEEEDSLDNYEEKLKELMSMSKEDLVDMCKDHDVSHTGSKKKLAERLLDIFGLHNN